MKILCVTSSYYPSLLLWILQHNSIQASCCGNIRFCIKRNFHVNNFYGKQMEWRCLSLACHACKNNHHIYSLYIQQIILRISRCGKEKKRLWRIYYMRKKRNIKNYTIKAKIHVNSIQNTSKLRPPKLTGLYCL